jgi:hypothetical protein
LSVIWLCNDSPAPHYANRALPAAQRTSGGQNLSGLPPETRASTAKKLGAPSPETRCAYPKGRGVPSRDRRTARACGSHRTPASPHTRFVSIRLEIFTPRPLSETCWVGIIPPYATCPLPHVPDHVQQPIGTGPFGVCRHRCRIALATFFELHRVASHRLPQG